MMRLKDAAKKSWLKDSGMFLLFLATLTATFYRGYGVRDNYYAISQWLVTYESGFIKRGLWGTLIQLEALAHVTGYSVPVLFFWLSNAILALLYAFAAFVLLRMVALNRAVICFIPYFLLGPLLRTQSVYIGYTDQVVMILAMVITYFVIAKKRNTVIILASLGILVHESVFVLAAPVICYGALIHYASCNSPPEKMRIWKDSTMMLIVPVMVFLSLIIYQEIFIPKEHLLAYLHDMLSRQDPPYYRIDMISEIYTFTFRDWFYIHKDEALVRMTAWDGLNGYFFVIFFATVALHAVLFLGDKRIRNTVPVLLVALWLIFSPLVLHLLVVDHDRVWNMVTWVSFLSLWVFWERFGREFNAPKSLWILFFMFTFFAMLFPQARSDLPLGTVLLMYMPVMAWYLLFMLGKPGNCH